MESLRLLWGSPLPPIRSGVSDYATEVLGPLGRLARVRVLRPPGDQGLTGWEPSNGVELVPCDAQPLPGELSLINIGNNPYHGWLLDRVLGSESVVVLHDIVLHHLLVEATVARGCPGDFEDLLTDAHGAVGRELAEFRRLGLVGKLDPFLFPATSAVLGHARAAVVHSQWAKDQVVRAFPQLPVGVIGMPVEDPGPIARTTLRESFGTTPESVLLMHLGFMTEEKGFDVILGAVAAARSCGAPVYLVVGGEGAFQASFQDAVAALGLRDYVLTTGWMDKAEFLKIPGAADLGVVLRIPSAGETSAALARFLACGTPVAVIGRRQFLEWPEEAAPRVSPGASAVADLTRILLDAADERQVDRWYSRRHTARRVYEARHRPEMVADQLVDFLRSLDS